MNAHMNLTRAFAAHIHKIKLHMRLCLQICFYEYNVYVCAFIAQINLNLN